MPVKNLAHHVGWCCAWTWSRLDVVETSSVKADETRRCNRRTRTKTLAMSVSTHVATAAASARQTIAAVTRISHTLEADAAAAIVGGTLALQSSRPSWSRRRHHDGPKLNLRRRAGSAKPRARDVGMARNLGASPRSSMCLGVTGRPTRKAIPSEADDVADRFHSIERNV